MRYFSLSGLAATICLLSALLPACSNNSAQLNDLEKRIAALENEQINFQAKQESLNTWEAGRLSEVEAKHPDIKVPPPPKYVVRETAPSTAAPTNPMQGGVVETTPGSARIEPASAVPASPQPVMQTGAQNMKVYPSPLSAGTPVPATVAYSGGQNPTPALGKNAQAQAQAKPAQPAVSSSRTTKTVTGTASTSARSGTPGSVDTRDGRVIDPNASPSPLKSAASSGTTEQSKAPRETPAQAAGNGGEKGTYASALRLVEQGRNAEGRAAMDKFMKEYPSSKLIPNAIYWKGETYYGEQNYQEAVLTFRDVTARFPKSAKAADALLKIGMSYQKMGDTQNAKFYLEQLTKEFPKTRAAALGKQQLSKIR